MIVCLVCGVCFTEIIIGEYFSPVFSYQRRDRPFPPWHMTCATPGFTRAPSQPAQVQPSPPDRKPRLFNKEIILLGAGKCSRNFTTERYDRRAQRAERVGRSFVKIGVHMHLRRSETSSPDAREVYWGRLHK